jgi:hypothetical protein
MMTLDELIAYHQNRGADCFAVMERATYIPLKESEALRAAAQFHTDAVRLLQTFKDVDPKRQ